MMAVTGTGTDLYMAVYANRHTAERAIKLIAKLHPSYRFEIIAEKGWLK